MPYTVVKFEIPYPLIWGKGGWFPIRLEGKDYEIAFERCWRSGNNVELMYDRVGRVSFTRVYVRFPHETASVDGENLRTIAHKAINRLLDVYRVSTKEFHIGHIPLHELGATDTSHGVYTEADDGSLTEIHSFQLDMGLGLTLARIGDIDDQAKSDLAYERPLPLVDLLMLNAKRSLLFEDFRIAVVEAETAFELAIDNLLRAYYLSEKAHTRVATSPASSQEMINRILEAGLMNLLKEHLPKAKGRCFVGTEVHSRWKNDLYNLRNAVVHEAKELGPCEARRALDAAESALSWIRADHAP